MPNCDMCGREGNLNQAIVEGSLLNVCDNCARFGKVILIKKAVKEIKHDKKPTRRTTELINIIVEDYPKEIKEAREKQGLKQEELAKKINEKESLIHKLETGHLQPTILIARKLEKVLNIKLIELYEEQHEGLNFKDAAVTIGDLVRLKHKN